MKKIFCVIAALFLVICIGCNTIDSTSSLISRLNETVTETESTSDDTATEINQTDASEPATIKTESEKAPIPSQVPSSTPAQVEVITEKVEENDIVIIKPEPVVIQGEKPMSYIYLTDEQQRIYDILNVTVRDMVEKPVDLLVENAKGDATNIENDINVAFRAVSFDNPEYFWIPTGYILMQSGDKRYVVFKLINDEYNLNYYPIEKSQRDTMQQIFDAKVTELTDTVKGMGGFETELYFHDYLCKNVVYTLADKDPLIYTAYGALVNGKAVCEGYSRAMQLLCNEVGIPCGLVYGEGVDESGKPEAHMWNLINLGDGWYHLDVTWDDDDKNNLVSYRYFNITEIEICTNHTMSNGFASGKHYSIDESYNFIQETCENTALNYFVKNNYYLYNDAVAAIDAINQVSLKGNCTVQLKNRADTLDLALLKVKQAFENRFSFTFATYADIIIISW